MKKPKPNDEGGEMSDDIKGALTEACLRCSLDKFADLFERKDLVLRGEELSLKEGKMCATTKDKNTDQIHYEKYHGRHYFLEGKEGYYIPHADSPGVYFIFAEDGTAVYVGKSESTIGERVWQHWKDYQKSDHEYGKRAAYVIAIPFDKNVSFLAPAFESYLLAKFKFGHNKVGQ